MTTCGKSDEAEMLTSTSLKIHDTTLLSRSRNGTMIPFDDFLKLDPNLDLLIGEIFEFLGFVFIS